MSQKRDYRKIVPKAEISSVLWVGTEFIYPTRVIVKLAELIRYFRLQFRWKSIHIACSQSSSYGPKLFDYLDSVCLEFGEKQTENVILCWCLNKEMVLCCLYSFSLIGRVDLSLTLVFCTICNVTGRLIIWNVGMCKDKKGMILNKEGGNFKPSIILVLCFLYC